MCGITGSFDARRDTSDDVLGERVVDMTRTIEHRGPDQGGQWVDGRDGIALGNRRLAIIDLSPLGDQPMFSASGRFVLVFNGEIYNFAHLRERLIAEGHAFAGGSDTEVVVNAVESWGIEATLEACNGMFALAAWDRRDKKLYLARDRFGEKPLYYGWMGHELLFGSELKALRAHPSFRDDIDRDALTLFMRHKYVPTPWSIYRNVKKLPAGTYIEIAHDARDAAPVPFYSAAAVAHRGVAEPFEGSDDDAIEALDVLLRDAVAQRMIADVGLGAFLSGGVDSSTVVALMQAQSSTPVKTFTIGLPEDAYNEAHYASAVAEHLGCDHTELLLTPNEVRNVVPLLPAMYDEPFADSSQIPTFLVSQLARQHVTVSLSGDGGDEVFGGYNRYVWVEKIWRKARSTPAGLRALAAGGLTSLSPGRWDALFRLAAPVLPASAKHRVPGDKLHKLAAALSVPDEQAMYLRLVSHWPDDSNVVLGTSEAATYLRDGASWPALGSFTNQMMYLDLVTYLPDDILVKLDRASMAVSLEGRVPMLDPRVVEFAWHLPPTMKIRDGETKWALRRVLDRYVPRELIDRPKSGFGVPIDAWLRGPLKEWASTLLDENRLASEGYFDPAPIATRWHEFQSGKRSWQYLLWDVLMFQSWLEAQRSESAVVSHVA
ncbi:MAG: asparagine synthase (glutamine-hydrolyzing) [Actinomycetota bacterium]